MSNDSLSALPVKNGFRIRGERMTRLETFVDAAFAFALTLLVISFDEIPTDVDQLIAALKEAPAFAASFALILMLWAPHRTWSQRFGVEDSLSTIISLALVFLVLIYVLPLRIMMSLAFSSVTGDWTPSNFNLYSFDEARLVMIIYGVGYVSSCMCIVLLNVRALTLSDELQLNKREQFITRATIWAWSIVASAGFVSVIIAVNVPEAQIWMGGWCYAMLGIVMPIYSNYVGKKAKRDLAGV